MKASERERSPGGAPSVRAVAAGARPRVLVTAADRLLLYFVVGLALVLLSATSACPAGRQARVVGADGFERVLPLDADARLEVPGPLGTTVVEVNGGAARVTSSPCPQHLCVRMGRISSAGESVVCVPNRVAVIVEGQVPSGTDAITR